MNKRRFCGGRRDSGFWRSRSDRKLAVMALALTGIVFATYAHVRGQQPPQNSVPKSPRDLTGELAMKVMAPFTVATVGDIIAPQPFGNQVAPEQQSLIKIIRDADVGFANLEMSLVDMARFPGPIMGTLGPKEVGADIKAMGITILNRANNHTFDGAAEGMSSTDAALDALGIVHAGTGKDLNEARAAHFIATPKGRVGLVGMVSVDTTLLGDPGSTYVYMAATYRSGDLGGRPGVNAVRLTTYHVVTPEQLQSLRSVRDAVSPVPANGGGGSFGIFASPEQNRSLSAATDRLRLFDSYFKAGSMPGTVSYEVNADDERDILQSIRNGKLYSDFVIATIHAHQGQQTIGGVRTVSDWLVDLAHKCIDNGADMFVVHGPHAIEGVEIYKGRPIFYGMSSFVFQTDLQISLSDKATLTAPGTDPLVWESNQTGLESPTVQTGMLATSHYEGGRLMEIRLYPADLGGMRRPMSLMGLPMTPSPEMARKTLEEMQTLSKPFGTKIDIDIDGGVGVIHLAPAAVETGKK